MSELLDFRANVLGNVFVSYSHANRDFARKLYEDLQTLGFKLWRDRSEMVGGEDWWRQIQEAIDGSETMVLCLSPEALKSKVVSDEWHYARQVGTRVIPVVASEVDFKTVPRWMGRQHWYDFRQGVPEQDLQWRAFINQLNTPYFARRTPFMVDKLPDDFVPRPEQFEPLVRALVDETHGAVAITAALEGAGGYGKTTLARAVCHDTRVRGAFDEGILWVTIGENTTEQDRINLILDVVKELSGGRPDVKTMDAAKAEFQRALGDRYLLLVIDDVWKREHLEPFLQGGSNCARLITTRYKHTLPADAHQNNVDAMSIEEAVKLLRAGLPAGEDEALKSLVKRLGEWPLLLKLVNGALRGYVHDEGYSLPQALKEANRALDRRGLVAFDSEDTESRNAAVRATLGVSIDLLKNPRDRQRFNQLAIFAEDVDIPSHVLEKLWGLDDFETRETCRKLMRAALLLRFEQNTIRLHDVVRAYLRGENKNTLAEWNSQPLAAYNPKNRPWYTIPHDGYLYFYLAYHLMEAGRKEELHHLLVDSPEWMRAKFKACIGDSAYVNDLELLIQEYHDPLPGQDLVKLVQLHSARQIVNHRIGRYDDQALAVLVWLGREQEALSHAYLRADAHQRFQGVLMIYQTLVESGQTNEHLMDNLTQIVTTIAGASSRVKALRALARALALAGQPKQAETAFSQAERVANSIQDTIHQADALRALRLELAQAGQQRIIPGEQVESNIGEAYSRLYERSRVVALVEQQNFEQAEQVASSIEDASGQASALIALGRALAQAGQGQQAEIVLSEAEQVASSIEDASGQASALIALGRALAQAGQGQQAEIVLSQAERVANSIEDASRRASALGDLAQVLTEQHHFEQAERVANSIEHAFVRASALRALASALAQAGQRQQAERVANSIEDPSIRADALLDLAQALAQAGQRQQAETVFSQAERMERVASSIEHASGQASALIALGRALAQAGQGQQAEIVLSQAERVASSIEYAYWRASALSDLASALAQAGEQAQAETVFSQAERVANSIEHAFKRADALRSLAQALAQQQRFEQAERVVSSIEDASRRASALRALASALAQAGQQQQADALFSQAQTVSQAIEAPSERVDALINLAQALAQAGEQAQAETVFSQAQTVSQAIEHALALAEPLRILAQALAQQQRFEQAERVARSIEHAPSRADALGNLAQVLTEQHHFEQAERVALSIEHASGQASALSELAQALAQAGEQAQAEIVFSQAERVARSIERASSREYALSELATALAQAQRFEQAQVVVQGIEYAYSRASALRDLATALAQAGQPQGALTIFGFQNVDTFLRLLAALQEGLVKTYGNEGHNLYLQVLIHATQILGWEQPGWAETHRLLVGENEE